MAKSVLSNQKFVFLDESGRRWKTFCLAFLVLGFALALVAGLVLWEFFGGARNKLTKIQGETNRDVIDKISKKTPGEISVHGSGTIIQINADQEKNTYSINREKSNKEKTVVLSFDDGPDPNYTPKILEILKKENVSATFFVVGSQVLKYPELVKKIVENGFELGNHTFSHVAIGQNPMERLNRVNFEIDFNQNLIEQATGISPKLFRNPYWGQENEISMDSLILTTFALDKGYLVSTPTLDSNDWQERNIKKIVQNSTTSTEGPVVLLLHDAGGDRRNTVLALPEIIKYYKSQGYSFQTLAALSGKATMPRVSLRESVSSNLLVVGYKFFKASPRLLDPVFLIGLGFTLTYSLFLIILANLESYRSLRFKKTLAKGNFRPSISVLVPAYNEEKAIAATIHSVLASNYKKFKLFIIDDGSTDNTNRLAKKFEKDSRVKVLAKENGGKFSALNYGLRFVRSSVFVALDADTHLDKNALGSLVKFFADPKVGAVAGNVKVGNRETILGKLQAIEYTMNLNLERNGYSALNSILVVPGALGAWRSSVVKKIGGYSGRTLTEDAELTIRLLRAGFRVVYDKEAVSYTEAPTKISDLIRQRFRWTFGVFQTFSAHSNLIFRRRHGFLGWLVLPFTIFVQIPIMLLSPLMDLFAIFAFFFISAKLVLIYLSLYLLTRLILGIVAFAFERESAWVLILMPLQRLYYQPILYISLFKALWALLKGAPVEWKKLDHEGNLSLGTPS
ncbi:MAG: glycosyltransferase [bacterium]|nr:glycosyltransferase [bacterium]